MQQANPARLQSAGWLSESGVSCEPDVFWQTTGESRASASVADWRITQGDSSHSERGRCSGTQLHYARLTGAVKMRSDSCQPLLSTEWGSCLRLCSVTCVGTRSRLQKQTWALESVCLSCQGWETSKKKSTTMSTSQHRLFYSPLKWWCTRWRSRVTIPESVTLIIRELPEWLIAHRLLVT